MQLIRAVVTVDRIVAEPTKDLIVAAVAEEVVVAVFAPNLVVAIAAAHQIIATTSADPVITAKADHLLLQRGANHDVGLLCALTILYAHDLIPSHNTYEKPATCGLRCILAAILRQFRFDFRARSYETNNPG